MSVTGRVINGVIVLPPGTVLPEGAEVKVETLAKTAATDPQSAAVEKVAPSRPDEADDDDEYDLEPTLSIAETEELRKVKSGRPLNEILSRLGIP